jgi:MFS family permease
MFSFCTGAAFVVTGFYLPLYFQAIEGSSATESGVKILPLIIAGALSSLVGGIGISMVGYYAPFMILGAAGCTIGLGLMTMLGVDTAYVKIMVFQILTGVFMGMNFQVPTPRDLSVDDRRRLSLFKPLFISVISLSLRR